jgi:hypothetical protein
VDDFQSADRFGALEDLVSISAPWEACFDGLMRESGEECGVLMVRKCVIEGSCLEGRGNGVPKYRAK